MTIDEARERVRDAMSRDPVILRGWNLRGLDPNQEQEKLAQKVLRVELDIEFRRARLSGKQRQIAIDALFSDEPVAVLWFRQRRNDLRHWWLTSLVRLDNFRAKR